MPDAPPASFPVRRRLSRGKRMAFRVLALVMVLVVTELACTLLCWLRADDKLVSWSKIARVLPAVGVTR